MTKVLMLSTVHKPDDHRIYHKETKSLEKAGYEVDIIAPAETSFVKHVWNVVKCFCKATLTDADVVHVHEPSSLLIGAILKPFKKFKLIYDVHEFYPENVALRLGIKSLEPWIIALESMFEKFAVFGFVDGVISVNYDIRMRFNTYCVRHAIIENYPSHEQFYSSGSDEELVYIGTCSEERGILQIIKAFNMLERGELTIVGPFLDTKYELECKYEARFNSRIGFVGNVPYNEIPSYIANCRAGLCVLEDIPKHANCIPSKFLEYMLASKPIIVTDIWEDWFKETGCGAVVPYNNIGLLTECMLEALENKDVLEDMGKAGNEYALTHRMTWERKDKQLIEFYKVVCK